MYTRHAIKRMRQRGLLHYREEISATVHMVKPILTNRSLELRFSDVVVVAAKVDNRPKIVTVWWRR